MKTSIFRHKYNNVNIEGLISGYCDNTKYTNADVNASFTGLISLPHKIYELPDFTLDHKEQKAYTQAVFINIFDNVNSKLNLSASDPIDLITESIVSLFKDPNTDPQGIIITKFIKIVHFAIYKRLSDQWALMYLSYRNIWGMHTRTFCKNKLKSTDYYTRKFFAIYDVIYELGLFGHLLYILDMIPFNDIPYVNSYLIYTQKTKKNITYTVVDVERLVTEMFCKYNVSATIIDRLNLVINGQPFYSKNINCSKVP